MGELPETTNGSYLISSNTSYTSLAKAENEVRTFRKFRTRSSQFPLRVSCNHVPHNELIQFRHAHPDSMEKQFRLSCLTMIQNLRSSPLGSIDQVRSSQSRLRQSDNDMKNQR